MTGCSALSSDINGGSGTPEPTLVEGPAQFTDLKIDVSETVTVDTTVQVTVSGFNYGTESGRFSGVVGTLEGASSESKPVELTNVQSGTRGETTVDFSFSAADEYVLAVVETARQTTPETATGLEPAAKSKLTISPKTGGVGDSFDLDSGLRAALTDVTYQQGVYHEYSSWFGSETTTDLFSTSDGQILALLRFEVENTGTESVSFGPQSFTVSDGALLTDLRNHELSGTLDVDGSPFGNTAVEAGQRVTGWFLAQVSRKRAKSGITVGWQRDTDKTPPERAWTVESSKLPSFGLEQWAVGKKQVPGEYKHTFTVKNTGSVKATFRGMLDRKSKQNGREWTPFRRFSKTIAPGTTKTFDVKETNLYVGSSEYRVRPFDTAKTVSVQTPKLSFGEKAVIPGGAMRISTIQTNPSYTYEDDWGTETYTPDDGDKFAFAYVEFIPSSGDSTNMPGDEHFSLRTNGTTYPESGSLRGPMSSPVEGKFYELTYLESDIRAGEPWAGWISFDVPSAVTRSNATIVLEKEYSDGRISGAAWSSK